MPTAEMLNQTLVQAVVKIFPALSRGKQGRSKSMAVLRAFFTAWKEQRRVGGFVPSLPTQVYHMWQRRKDLLKSRLYDASGIIRTWKWLVLYIKAGRQSKQYHTQNQRAATLGNLQLAERAAQQHNTKRLFGIVKRMIPWKPRPKIMFRHPDGAPMSLSAPATAWKACSRVLSSALAKVCTQFSQVCAELPTAWRDPQLCFLPKPNKAPSTAAALRPIGLLRPDGKALAGHVKDLVLTQAGPSLAYTPQYAYLPNRDTTDALARIDTCVLAVKEGFKALGRNRFIVRDRKEAGSQVGEAGGCLLSVDLSQAFDRVNRAKLDRALLQHQVDANLRSTITAIHDEAAYQVSERYHSTKIKTTQQGIQGCRLAPALWSILSSQVLWDLTPAEATPMQLPGTLFADEHLGHWQLKNNPRHTSDGGRHPCPIQYT